MTVSIKTELEIEKMRVAGRLASEVLDMIEEHVVAGITTDELNTICQDGYHGDNSRMYFVGKPSILAQRICDVARESMLIGIEMVKPGIKLGDIGHAIQTHAEKHNFSVVREYCGHGIGKVFHEEPQILHYGKPNTGMELVAGMTFTIEPMINAGKKETRLLADDWTVVTRDHSLSAQWEHTLLVNESGFEILTDSANAVHN